jgi:putative transposase
MIKTFKYRIYPTKPQQEFLSKNFGCVRFIFNHSLGKTIKDYEENKGKFNKIKLINDIKTLKDNEEYSWLKEVESTSLQQAVEDLQASYQRFFRKLSSFPNFKSKSNKQSLRMMCVGNNIRLLENTHKIKLPKLGNVKIKKHRELEGRISSITITKNPSNQYHIMIRTRVNYEYEKPSTPKIETSLGIDLGIKDLAIFSNGDVIKNIKPLKRNLANLKYQQRKLSKKQKGSNNRNKQRVKVAKLHQKISNIRENYLHQVTHSITKMDYDSFVLEDLGVSNMIKNHKLAQSIQDVSWNKFKQFLEYKAKKESKNIIYIGRFDASSKICNSCWSTKPTLLLSEREWVCENCGIIHDRDINAAKNIKDIFFKKYSPSEGGVEPVEVLTLVEPMKQEA